MAMDVRNAVHWCRSPSGLSRWASIALLSLCLFLIHLNNATSFESHVQGQRSFRTFQRQTLRIYEYRAKSNLTTASNRSTEPPVVKRECRDSLLDNAELDDRFDAKCGWWVSALASWKEMVRSSKHTEHLHAAQERSGTGDRLMGAMTALYQALHRGSKLTIAWDSIDQIFQPSCHLRNASQNSFRLSGKKTWVNRNYCIPHSTYYSCGIGKLIIQFDWISKWPRSC